MNKASCRDNEKGGAAMNSRLSFKDKEVEQAYGSNLRNYRFKYFKFYLVCTFIIGNVLWFLNPHNKQNFEDTILKQSLANDIVLFCAMFVFFKLKTFRYPQAAILVFQIYVCVGLNETWRQSLENMNGTTYIGLTIMMENVVLLPLIARSSWKCNAISSGILNLYLGFRFPDLSDNVSMRGYPSLVFLGNFLVNSVGCYFAEKYDRENFLEKYKGEQNLRGFETIIKEIIPTAIIITKAKDVIFSNNESKLLLNYSSKEELDQILRKIVLRQKERKSPCDKFKNQKLFSKNDSDDEIHSPRKQETLFKVLAFKKEDKPLNEFELFEGKLERLGLSTRFLYLEIKVGRITWEGQSALMTILSEDRVCQQVRFLKEQAMFKDKLLVTVSHDLRTPLNGIIGMLELALENIFDRDLRKTLQLALRSSKLLNFLINDIIDFSEISNERLRLAAQEFNVLEMLREVCKLIKFQAKRKGVEFIFQNEVSSDSLLLIRSDPNRFKQVIVNLLSNALKFTERGSIILKVDCPHPASPALRFSVCDTGCGVRQEDIPNLFHLFGKLKNKEHSKSNMNGIGLGLAISQSLVRHLNSFAAGEDIRVKSQVGQGSIFYFTLHPLPEEKSEQTIMEVDNNNEVFIENTNEHGRVNSFPSLRTKSMSLTTLPRPETRSQRARILLVDDDQINILALTSYLKSYSDCEYETAFNGKEAVENIKAQASKNCFYDLVLMDINMPVMDGFEATRLIFKLVEEQTIPQVIIIAATANSSPDDYQKSFQCGMSDHISKPFTKGDLRAKIDKWLGKKK